MLFVSVNSSGYTAGSRIVIQFARAGDLKLYQCLNVLLFKTMFKT